MRDYLSPQSPSYRLAEWVVQVPESWTRQGFAIAHLAVKDTLLCAVSGAGELKWMHEVLYAGSGNCPIPGGPGIKVLPDAAALVWGTAIHQLEQDDQTYSLGGHLMCTALPALVCSQYGRQVSWPSMLDAIVVACDVASRLNRAMTRKHMEHGWVATTTYGLVAATCAIARIERFNVEQTLAAISLACNKAFGNKNLFGTPAKPVNPGLAARDAVMLATLARAGLQASSEPLQGDFGFGAMYRGSAQPDWPMLFGDDEAAPFINSGMAFKLYPCCASSHRCVDALLEIRATHAFQMEDVKKITAFVGPLNYLTLRYEEPRNVSEARFSMQFILASSLRYGSPSLANFTPTAVFDPVTRSLLGKIKMCILEEASGAGYVEKVPLAHRVEIELMSGERFHKTVLDPKGSPLNPFAKSDWDQKFEQCSMHISSQISIGKLQYELDSLMVRPVEAVVDLIARLDCV